MNFYAQNFSSLVRVELKKLVQEQSCDHVNNIEKKVIVNFFLKMASQSTALASLLIDELLNSANKDSFMEEDSCAELETDLLSYFVTFFALENSDSSMANDLFSFLKQINNSVAIFDLVSSLLEWFTSKDDCFELHESSAFIKSIQNLMVNLIFFFHSFAV